MHSDVKYKAKNEQENEISVEAKKIVDLIIEDIIEISDEEESLEDITLEETCVVSNASRDKKYTNKCEVCGFEATSNKRYLALQLLSKHK